MAKFVECVSRMKAAMIPECYPMSVLPHVSRLYADYLDMEDGSRVREWFGSGAMSGEWMGQDVSVPDAGRLADLLVEQA